MIFLGKKEVKRTALYINKDLDKIVARLAIDEEISKNSLFIKCLISGLKSDFNIDYEKND